MLWLYMLPIGYVGGSIGDQMINVWRHWNLVFSINNGYMIPNIWWSYGLLNYIWHNVGVEVSWLLVRTLVAAYVSLEDHELWVNVVLLGDCLLATSIRVLFLSNLLVLMLGEFNSYLYCSLIC